VRSSSFEDGSHEHLEIIVAFEGQGQTSALV